MTLHDSRQSILKIYRRYRKYRWFRLFKYFCLIGLLYILPLRLADNYFSATASNYIWCAPHNLLSCHHWLTLQRAIVSYALYASLQMIITYLFLRWGNALHRYLSWLSTLPEQANFEIDEYSLFKGTELFRLFCSINIHVSQKGASMSLTFRSFHFPLLSAWIFHRHFY